MSRLFGRGSIFTVGTVLEAGLAFLVLPVVTRALAPAEYGVVAAALVVAAVATYGAALGMPSAVARVYFFEQGGPRSARTIVAWTFIVACVVVGPVALSGPLWSRAITGVEFGPTIAFGVMIAVPASVALAAQSFLSARDRPLPFMAVSITGTAIGQLAGLALLLFTDAGGAGYTAGLLAGRCAAASLGWILVVNDKASKRASEGASRARTLSAALQLGLPTVPHSVANYLLIAGDRLVVANVDGPAAAGRYQLAYVVGSLAVIFVTSVNQAWGPIIYGAADWERWGILRRTTAALHHVGAALGASLAVGCPVLLALVAPASYGREELLPATAVVTLSVIPMVSYLAGHHVLFQVARTGALAWITPLTTVTNLALNVVLVQVLGLLGASITTVASFLMLAVLVRWRAMRLATVPWDIGAELRAWILVGAAVAASVAAPSDGYWTGLRVLLAAALLGVGLHMAIRLARVASPAGRLGRES